MRQRLYLYLIEYATKNCSLSLVSWCVFSVVSGPRSSGIYNTDVTGALVHNLSYSRLSTNAKEKYSNLSWFAVPMFLTLHVMTCLGAFPWIFILTATRALAGESTAKQRDTVSACLWACGYPVNCAAVLVALHFSEVQGFDHFSEGNTLIVEAFTIRRALAAGYVGWSLSMWILLIFRAVLDRNPLAFGGMFNEVYIDICLISYPTSTSTPTSTPIQPTTTLCTI